MTEVLYSHLPKQLANDVTKRGPMICASFYYFVWC